MHRTASAHRASRTQHINMLNAKNNLVEDFHLTEMFLKKLHLLHSTVYRHRHEPTLLALHFLCSLICLILIVLFDPNYKYIIRITITSVLLSFCYHHSMPPSYKVSVAYIFPHFAECIFVCLCVCVRLALEDKFHKSLDVLIGDVPSNNICDLGKGPSDCII